MMNDFTRKMLMVGIGSLAQLSFAADATLYNNTFRRLAGVPPNLEQRAQIESFAEEDNMAGVISLAFSTSQFGYVTARHIAERMCGTYVFDSSWNDCSFSVAAAIVQEQDLRNVLFGDSVATCNLPNLQAASPSNNTHYAAIPATVNLSSAATFTAQTTLYGLPADSVAGVLTSRQFGQEILTAGTNRAVLEKGYRHVLGVELKEIKDNAPPMDHISGDVSFFDSKTNTIDASCTGCHRSLDAARPAFAFLDFVNNRVTRLNTVAAKYSRNSNVNNGYTTPSGYVVTNSEWKNYYLTNPALGFRTDASRNIGNAELTAGSGAASFAKALSTTTAFSKQLAKLAMNVVCNEPKFVDFAKELNEVALAIEQSGYKLKAGFEKAALTMCAGE